jgi:hypothetical protein
MRSTFFGVAAVAIQNLGIQNESKSRRVSFPAHRPTLSISSPWTLPSGDNVLLASITRDARQWEQPPTFGAFPVKQTKAFHLPRGPTGRCRVIIGADQPSPVNCAEVNHLAIGAQQLKFIGYGPWRSQSEAGDASTGLSHAVFLSMCVIFVLDDP